MKALFTSPRIEVFMFKNAVVATFFLLALATLTGCHHVAEVTLTGTKTGPDLAVHVRGTPQTISKGTTLRWKVDSSVAGFQIRFVRGGSPCDATVIQSVSGVAQCDVTESAVKQKGQKYYYSLAVSVNQGDDYVLQPPQPCDGCEDDVQ